MSEYEDLDAQLRAWLDHDEAGARAATQGPWRLHRRRALAGYPWMIGAETDRDVVGDGYDGGVWEHADARLIVAHEPSAVLADIAGKRALLDHVAGWQHTYNDDDGYFSCGLAVDPEAPFPEPGTGCWDDLRSGIRCSCVLDGRRFAVLRCIAAGYASRPGFKAEWRLDD